ncbi:MAG: dCTP deaminase [Thermoplasmatota archaeon]
MAVLSDADIVAALDAKELGIVPFEPRNLTPNGVDLTVAEVMLPDSRGDARVSAGTVAIPAKERFLVSTRERVSLPRDATAQLWLRTTWGRRGVIAMFGKVDAGFAGTLTIPAFNASASPLELPIGDRFCQIVFERLGSAAARPYAESSGHYQNQSGVTLARE